MRTDSEFGQRIDALLIAENNRFLAEVLSAPHLTDETPLNERYYLRHRIETIKRIRMTAHTDALALAAMVHEDYDAARLWARYICVELDHDRMFYDDLAHHGVSRHQVDVTPELPATRALDEYLRRRIARDGAIAAVAYSVFVEWNSARFSRRAIEKARAAFGDSHIGGSVSHLEVDEDEDHYETMVDVAGRLTSDPGREQAFRDDLSEIAKLFRHYFHDLHQDSTGHGEMAA